MNSIIKRKYGDCNKKGNGERPTKAFTTQHSVTAKLQERKVSVDARAHNVRARELDGGWSDGEDDNLPELFRPLCEDSDSDSDDEGDFEPLPYPRVVMYVDDCENDCTADVMKQQVGPIGEAISAIGSAASSVENFASNVNNVAASLHTIEEFMTRLKKTMNMRDQDDVFDGICSRLETFLIAVWTMSQQQTLQEMLGVATLYIKTWQPNKSIALVFTRFVNEAFASMLSGAVNENGEDSMHLQSGWFSENWEVVSKGPLGVGLGSTISTMIMFGLLPQKPNNDLTAEFFKVLPENPTKIASSVSVLEYVFKTLDWIVDCVWPALSTGDMSLLISDKSVEALSASYRVCLDAVQRSLVGQMDSVKEMYGLGSDAEILVYLQKCANAHEEYVKRLKPKDSRRVEIQQRLIRLDKIVSDFTASWHDKGLRVKPFTFMIVGGSSVGKSTLAGLVAHVIAKVNGFPEGKEYSCTLNGNDKFQSEFSSKHVHVLFDDVGNARPEVSEGNPSTLIVQFANNIHTSALSAELEKKGKNDIRVKTLGITSNVRDLHAGYWSVNAASIMRRIDLVVEVRLKPDSVGPNGGIHPRFANDPQPDAWDIDLYTIQVVRSTQDNLADTWFRKPVFADASNPFSTKVRTVSVVELIDYLSEVTPKHFATQDVLVDTSCELHLKEHCVHHPLFTVPCKKCVVCPDDGFEPMEKQAGGSRLPELDVFFLNRDLCVLDALPRVGESDESSSLTLVQRIQHLSSLAIGSLSEAARKVREAVMKDPVVAVLSLISFVGLSSLVAFGLKRSDMVPEEGIMKRIAEASKKPSTFVKAQNVYQRVFTNKLNFPKASISSTLDQFEKKVSNSLYLIVVQRIHEETGVELGGSTWANAFPVGSCCWATVSHVFERGCCYRVKFQISSGVGIKKVTAMVNDTNLRRHPTDDFCVINVPAMGDNADLSKYIVDDNFEYPVGAPLFIYTSHKDQVLYSDVTIPCAEYKATSKISSIEDREVTNFGIQCMLIYECDNFHGMCGSLVVMPGRNPVIVGMHCCGIPAKKECGAILPSKKFIAEAIGSFGGIRILESSPLREAILGKSVSMSNVVHEKNPVHFIEADDTNLTVFGQHDQPLSKFKSDVIKSPMCEHLKDVLGVDVEFGAPPKDAARPSFRRFLVNGSTFDETKLVNPAYVAVALEDKKETLRASGVIPRIRDFVHSMNYYDALNGVPGEKGFEPVNPLTSMGFPLNRPKYKFFEHSPLAKELGLESVRFVSKQVVDGVERFVYDLRFDKELVDVEGAIEEMFEHLARGERANVVFRCNLKDEPISFKKIENKKIRVFSGAPVHFVVASRMINLATQQLQKAFPSVFECAVGVNATGRDWKHIYDFITQFGEDFCGDGDYTAFDQSIDPQLSKADMDFRRWFLEECGFPEEFLLLFDGIATETIFPIFELDGLIFSAYRLSASGTPDTVERNSGQNTLITRYCYYSANNVKELGKIPLFRNVCACMTYGDDIIFNFNVPLLLENQLEFGLDTLSIELDKIGMTFTNALKEHHTTKYMHVSEISFLKRKFLRHPQLKEIVGALEIKSIFKSLTMSRKPKAGQRESVAEICAANLNNALRELYWHGEQYYDQYYPGLVEVARRSIDAEGQKVADYFTPITKEEIAEGFFKTFTVYPEALAKAGVEPMEMQSGILDAVSSVVNGVVRQVTAVVLDASRISFVAVVGGIVALLDRRTAQVLSDQSIVVCRVIMNFLFPSISNPRSRLVGQPLLLQNGATEEDVEVPFPPILLETLWDRILEPPAGYDVKRGSFKNYIRLGQKGLADLQIRRGRNWTHAGVLYTPQITEQLIANILSQISAYKAAERERENFEMEVRAAVRAYNRACGVPTLFVGDFDEYRHIPEYDIYVDLSIASTIFPRVERLLEEHAQWSANDQFLDEVSDYSTNIVPVMWEINVPNGVLYYGPKPSVRALHILGALVEGMEDPTAGIEMSHGVVIPGVDGESNIQIYRYLFNIYEYIHDDWWRREVWNGMRREYQYGPTKIPGVRLDDLTLSKIILAELDEIEFELGHKGVFPKFLRLVSYVQELEFFFLLHGEIVDIREVDRTMPAVQA